MKFSEFEVIVGIICLILLIGGIIVLFFVNKSFCGNGVCQEGEMNLCIADCNWCGDGYCMEDEKGTCTFDCNWCGDNFCQEEESCSSCQEDCGDCKSEAFCGDMVCNIGECESGCTKDCKLTDCQNGICEVSKGENCVTTPADCKCEINQKCNRITKKCDDITCGNGVCDSGETSKTCSADCKEEYLIEDTSNTNYPIIFVHGHSIDNKETTTYSINAWTEMQDRLNSDGLVIDKGIILPSSDINQLRAGVWGELGKPISVRTTYYKGHIESDNFVIGNEDEKSIIEYGERLKTVVETIKHHTGKDKVILIAHSMGGLVSRSYIRNSEGSENVYALITVGTPHHGVDGNESAYFGLSSALQVLCQTGFVFIDGHEGEECDDMWYESNFILNLNSGDETYGDIKYYSIMGDCCIGYDGSKDDEAVSVDSATLNGAKNIIISGNEVEGTGTFHQNLISPSKVPKVYNGIKEILMDEY